MKAQGSSRTAILFEAILSHQAGSQILASTPLAAEGRLKNVHLASGSKDEVHCRASRSLVYVFVVFNLTQAMAAFGGCDDLQQLLKAAPDRQFEVRRTTDNCFTSFGWYLRRTPVMLNPLLHLLLAEPLKMRPKLLLPAVVLELPDLPPSDPLAPAAIL